jgi:hypothetical protein
MRCTCRGRAVVRSSSAARRRQSIAFGLLWLCATACGDDSSPPLAGATETATGATTSGTSGTTTAATTNTTETSETSETGGDDTTAALDDSSGDDGVVVDPPPAFETHFTRPEPDQPDLALEDIVIELLESTPAGESVRAAYYTFTRTRIADAFVDAHERGVDVQLVLGNTNNPDGAALTTLRTGLEDRLTICREGQESGGCIGDRIQHNKFILFSELEDGSRDVVLQSSANFTNPQTNQFNNLVVIRDDTALYEAYSNYWTDLLAQVTNLDYYHSVVGDLQTKAYFYPRASGDTIVGILNNVDCAIGADVYLGMAIFTNPRIAIAERLVEMDAQGCNVHVLTRDGGNSGDILATLSVGTIDLTLQPIMHSKYLVIDGAYGANSSHQKLVWTGSHNFTGPALRRNDETLLKIRQDEVFEAFLEDWQHARSTAQTLHP